VLEKPTAKACFQWCC
jgi:hypothetical protein